MADTVLVIGCRLKPQETCFEHPQLIDPNRQIIIQIDIEPRNASWTIPSEIALIGDAGLTMSLIYERLVNRIDISTSKARRDSFVDLKKAQNYFLNLSYHPKILL